jgi:hypothetical protein
MPIAFSYAISILTALIVGTAIVRKSGFGAASSLFAFTFIWVLAYPLRGYLLASLNLPNQAPTRPSQDNISIGLLVSCLFLIAVTAGYFVSARKTMTTLRHGRAHGTEELFWPVTVGTVVASVVSIFVSLSYGFDGATYVQKLYGSAMSYRPGNGWFFMLAEISTLVTISLFAWLSLVDRIKSKTLLGIALAAAIVAAIVIMAMLNTRRPIAYLLLLTVLIFAIRVPRARLLIPVVLIASLFATQMLQLARFTCFACTTFQSTAVGEMSTEVSEIVSKEEQFVGTVSKEGFIHPKLIGGLIATSSSYEGVDHVATWLEQTTYWQKLTGVDHGISWLFNAALSLVPRNLWHEKPQIYGSLAQQAFLYPSMFATASYVTLPVTVVVDFSYAFGIPIGLLMAYLLGIALRWVDTRLYMPANYFSRALAIYIYINMFNVVRSGTGLIQGLVLFGSICFAVLATSYLLGRIGKTGAHSIPDNAAP